MTVSLAATDLLALLAGIAVAAVGGATFLKGVLGVAAWLRLPNFLAAASGLPHEHAPHAIGDATGNPDSTKRCGTSR